MIKVKSRKKSYNKIVIKVDCDRKEHKKLIKEMKKAIHKWDRLFGDGLQFDVTINQTSDSSQEEE